MPTSIFGEPEHPLITRRDIAIGVSLLAAGSTEAGPAPTPLSGAQPINLTGASVGFAPFGGAADLQLSVIASAKKRLLVCGFQFSSAKVAAALADAHIQRRVAVAVVLDAQSNTRGDMDGKCKAAILQLTTAKIQTRLVRAFDQTRGNFMVVDDETVQTGSFGFTEGAARSSSDVIVLRKRPDLATEYTRHWESIWHRGVAYSVR